MARTIRKATSEERSEAIRLRYEEGWKLTEIAEQLGRAVSTINSWTNKEVGKKEKERKRRWQRDHPEYQSEYLQRRRGKLGPPKAKESTSETQRGAMDLPSRDRFPMHERREARHMADAYELFYCLEVTARELVTTTLLEQYGKDWWDVSVPQAVRDNVARNIGREIDSAVTLRSEEKIDFTTFGELTDIILKNWEHFSDAFRSLSAFKKVMSELNVLRGPIAHCCCLAPDEVIRLELRTRDWFRLQSGK